MLGVIAPESTRRKRREEEREDEDLCRKLKTWSTEAGSPVLPSGWYECVPPH